MPELKPFDETETLVVGKYYNVRCAILKAKNSGNITHLPIIGHEHKDVSFGADALHYHIDGRFARVGFVDNKGITNTPLWVEKWDAQNGYELNGFTVRRTKCKRLTTGVNPPLQSYATSEPSKYMKWYRNFIGKSCAGRKCPHYGTHMLERNGRLVCPLHNLQADIVTEKIIEPIVF